MKPERRATTIVPALFFVLLALPPPLRAAGGRSRDSDGVVTCHAVICGVADYLYVSDLDYSDDDATDIYSALVGARNWSADNVVLLVDSQATKSAIQGAIADMAANADDDDICLFFFSGHGGMGASDMAPADEDDGKDEYIAVHEGTSDMSTNIRDDELGDWLAQLPTAKYVVFIDACNSGGGIKSFGVAKGLGTETPAPGDGFAADLRPAPTGTRDLDDNGHGVVVTACDDTETCVESGAPFYHGIFSYYLIKALTDPFPAEANANGWISGEEAHAYTGPLAAAENSGQHAQLYDGHAGDLDFLQWYGTTPALTVSLPDTATEGDGTVQITVSIPEGLPGNRTLELTSSHPTQLIVPATRLLSANTTSTTWDTSLVDDTETNGARGVTVTASLAGFADGNDTVTINDDDVHHFVIDDVPAQTAMAPFSVTIEAETVDNMAIPSFSGSVALSAQGDAGAVLVAPVVAGPFVAGEWTGDVTLGWADTDVRLTADDGAGHTGQSAAFDVGSNAGQVEGTVWYDGDGDGTADTGESAQPLWTVYLDLNGSRGLDPDEPAALTGGDGEYAFVVPPGVYTVLQQTQPGWSQTFPGPGTAGSGGLTFRQAVVDSAGTDGLAGARSVAVTPDGRHVYVASSSDSAVTFLARDDQTGDLTYVGRVRYSESAVDGLNWAESVVVSPDGAYVCVAGNSGDAVAVFARHAITGELFYQSQVEDGVGGVDGLDSAIAAAFSPDGAYVYVASRHAGGALTVFSRSATTGQLTFVEVVRNGVGGASGVSGAHGVTISPDGKHVYVAASYDDAVAVFSRNVADGTVAFVEKVVDGQGGADGPQLDVAQGVAVSPDGANLYAAANGDDAVTVFSRDSGTGQLTFVQLLADGVGGVDGLASAKHVLVSSDGAHVYVAGGGDDAIAVFNRNGATGGLTFGGTIKDTDAGVDGLDLVQRVALGPDGRHLYAAAYTDSSVSVFTRDRGDLGGHEVVVQDLQTVSDKDFGVISSYDADLETDTLAHWPWTTGGDAAWVSAVDDQHTGARSLKSGTITHDQTSRLQVIQTRAAGDFSFYCRVSSESGADKLTFYVDDVEQGAWSGEIGWTEVTVAVSAGTHTYRWDYTKDSSQSVGSDAAREKGTGFLREKGTGFLWLTFGRRGVEWRGVGGNPDA